MASELGGRRGAQVIAVLAALPACLGTGALMQYVAFDYLCWVLTAYFVIHLLKSNDPRWCVAIGASIGLGFMTKYSMAFFVAALVVGMLLTPARRYLKSKWFWCGVALAALICSPNFVWQMQHHFISLDFLKHIHERDVRIGRTRDFLPDQLKLTLLAIPLWLAGLHFYLFAREGRQYRVLGWMYVVPLLLFVVAKGRGYYLLPAYPMLYAAGATWGERQLANLRRSWANGLRAVAWTALVANAMLVAAITLPMTPVGSAWWKFASAQNGDLVEEIGWPELARTVAGIRSSLPAGESVGIIGANYGEAGAINLYGPQYGLPQAISGINSFWARGYPDPAPQTLIVLGLSQRFRDSRFNSCELAGHVTNPYDVLNEETKDHPDIFICRGLKQSWPEFWKSFRYYG
jgi:4-amino-4-deoxy-L-arabinose transferase-like glycosyltransferase